MVSRQFIQPELHLLFTLKRNGYCISALILDVAVCESKLCLKAAVSSRKAGRTHCSVLSDLPVNRADDMSLEMIVQLSNNSAEEWIAYAERF